MNDTFMADQYKVLLEKAIEQDEMDLYIYEELDALPLETVDELQIAYLRFTHELQVKKLEDRLLKGAVMIDNEPDPIRKSSYMVIYDKIVEELETLRAA